MSQARSIGAGLPPWSFAVIHIVTSKNRHLYARQLQEMHQLRRLHFIEENGWTDLKVVDGGEVDQFDDDLAVYLLALGPDDEIEVGLRVRSTLDGCILTDAFPQMVAEGAPPLNGPEAWEMSRIFSTHAYRKNRRGGRRVAEAFLAAMEVAHAHGARRLVGMVDMRLYPLASNIAWDLKLTGLPAPYAFGVMAGVYAPTGASEIARLRESLGGLSAAGYEVEDEDLALCGDFQAIESQFRRASAAVRPMVEVDEGPHAIAAAAALYAYFDGRRIVQPEREPTGA